MIEYSLMTEGLIPTIIKIVGFSAILVVIVAALVLSILSYRNTRKILKKLSEKESGNP